ncbi:High-affinity branched-chain amino acid transport system permease protein LivH [bacterium HR12]|nr:High-affinity branched-chain amino acid transport system permease protein LivH [bacterium HR12]GIU99114.1 MAG: branched-chain amino acid ABC transporter permease [Actinomycetota bacterium]
MDAFLNSLASGLIVGSLYAIMAMGLTILYGVSHVFNFAHGHVAVVAAYLVWFAAVRLGLALPVGVAAALLVMVVLALATYWGAIRGLLRRSEWGFGTLLFTLGLAILAEYALLELFGPRVKSVPAVLPGSVRLWFGRLALNDLFLITASVVLMVLVGAFLKRTLTGQAMRAVAQSLPGAQVVGIDIDRIYGATFIFAFVMTGLSGVLLGTKTYMTPHIGWEWMIKGFVIVAFGGLGSVPGAIVAAFLLGVVEALVTLYLGAIWIWPAWLVTFIVALWLRPQGILGGRST